MPTTTRGIQYPTSSDNTQLWTHYQNLATTADTAIGNALNHPVNLLSDVDTATNAPSVGQALVWDGTNWTPQSVLGSGGSTVRDRRWVTGSGDSSTDEFNDSSLNSAWVQARNASYPSGAIPTYVESGDILSVRYDGTTADGLAGRTSALVRPLSGVGGSMATGDAFYTAFDSMAYANYRMSGLILSTSSGSTGNMLYARWWTGGIVGMRTQVDWAGDTTTSGTTDRTYRSGLTYLRIVRKSSSTWRVDISVDGIQWILGGIGTWAFEPTHVGFGEQNFNTTTPSVTGYEFIRRQSGVS